MARRLFKCDIETPIITIIDLPRQNWRYCPPDRWQVAMMVVGIIISAIIFAIV